MCLLVRFLSICPSTIPFPDSNSKTVCPIKFKLDKDIDHQVAFEIGVISSFHLSVYSIDTIM